MGSRTCGTLLMGGSPADNDWYTSLNKAPRTPPGWVFGFAWTTIMILYSIYLSRVFKSLPNEKLKLAVVLFLAQWFFNVCWNPIFFVHHALVFGCIFILLLFAVLVLFHLKFVNKRRVELGLILPYLLWLCVAFSLNLYVFLRN
ncbi:MAG: tryptophan-rich sensory protein [Crocinitomicaceae bacterium]|nr:MAG: tryptophan-rich sensory protein [Crocinitomicaceae bacterium]